MPSRQHKLSLACLLALCLRRAEPFSTSSPKLSSRPTSIKTQGLSVSAFEATTPLRYRDDSTQEILAESIATPTSAARTTTANPHSIGVSMPLIRAIWFNQASILLFATVVIAGLSIASGGSIDFSSLHWNGSANFHPFSNFEFTPVRLFEGFLATLPLIGLGSLIEKSDHQDASYVNFSTTNMVISLFGRRKSNSEPTAAGMPLIMLLSAAIALSTGISEEVVFRGYLPSAIESMGHSIPIALAGQAALFAFAHISPTSRAGENKVVGGMQFVNGLWYGAVYLMTGGDILPCIVAHMLYDMHVLCETWSVINSQMDYTQQAFCQPLHNTEELAIQRIQEKAGTSLNDETLNFAKRFFYAFDSQHQGTLSLPDVHRAVSYAIMQDKEAPRPTEVDSVFGNVIQRRDSLSGTPTDRVSMSEFLQVLFSLKSRAAA